MIGLLLCVELHNIWRLKLSLDRNKGMERVLTGGLLEFWYMNFWQGNFELMQTSSILRHETFGDLPEDSKRSDWVSEFPQSQIKGPHS